MSDAAGLWSDLHHLVTPEDDHISSRRSSIRCPVLELGDIRLVAPEVGAIRIGQHGDLPSLSVDHHMRSGGLPLVAQRFVEHPVTEEVTTEFRAFLIDRTAPSGDAMPAPIVCRFVEIIDIGQATTQRAGFAGAVLDGHGCWFHARIFMPAAAGSIRSEMQKQRMENDAVPFAIIDFQDQ